MRENEAKLLFLHSGLVTLDKVRLVKVVQMINARHNKTYFNNQKKKKKKASKEQN